MAQPAPAPKPSKTVKEILEASAKARADLTAYEHALQDRISTFDDISFTRQLTDAERKDRDKLRLAQANCRHALLEVAFITVRTLDDSDEVRRITNEMRNVRASIDSDKAKIAKIEKVAAKAATATKVLVTLAEKLSALLI